MSMSIVFVLNLNMVQCKFISTILFFWVLITLNVNSLQPGYFTSKQNEQVAVFQSNVF